MLIVPDTIVLPGARMRPWHATDAPALAAAFARNDAHLRRWTPWVIDGRVPGQSLSDRLAAHAAAFHEGREWVYGIVDTREDDETAHEARTGAVLGGCGLYPRIGPAAVEIGYWLAVEAMGRGLATAAAEALVRVAFGNDTVERVEIRCAPGNVASARVPARLGFRHVGSLTEPAGIVDVWVRTRLDG
jgi:RimJ/RimL family protein N-acetyltransferase